MNIDKPTEPRIPDLPLGVSLQEMLGDPSGRDGGGRGKRLMRDWSGGRSSRRMLERCMDGSRRGYSRSMSERCMDGSRRGDSRRMSERRMDGSRRGYSRRMSERRMDGSRRNERPSIEHGGDGGSSSGEGVNRSSVAWRRRRESHWRMTGEWLDPIEPQGGPSSSGVHVLRVAEPVAKEESPEIPWRPWEADRPDSNPDQDLRQIVSQLQSSVVGSHKEYVGRSIPLVDCPSSNLHHFVLPVPHTAHEVYPSLDVRAKNSIFKGKI